VLSARTIVCVLRSNMGGAVRSPNDRAHFAKTTSFHSPHSHRSPGASPMHSHECISHCGQRRLRNVNPVVGAHARRLLSIAHRSDPHEFRMVLVDHPHGGRCSSEIMDHCHVPTRSRLRFNPCFHFLGMSVQYVIAYTVVRSTRVRVRKLLRESVSNLL
jgi:hypothetical protein